MDFPKVLNIILGILFGFTVVIALSNYLDSSEKQSSCDDIVQNGQSIGQHCTYKTGRLLESVEVTPEACFEKVFKQYGNKDYALKACYDTPPSDKRPL